jgi:putative flippase GtrA
MRSLGSRTSRYAASVAGQAGRYAIVGAVNTLLTGGLFYTLTFVWPAWFAYTVAFTLGIVFVATVSPRLVFQARPSASRRAAYTLWYFAVYLVGLASVRVLDDLMRLDHLFVVVLTVAVTATLGFVGGRVILTRRPHGEGT